MANSLTLARLRAVPVLLAAGGAESLLWPAGSSAALRLVGTLRDPGRRADVAQTAGLVVDGAMALLLVAGTWLAVATVAVVVSQTAPRGLAQRCPVPAPLAWRRLVIALLGTGMLTMPVVVPATAANPDPQPDPERSAAHALQGLPYPDRPMTTAAGSTSPTSARPTRVVVRPGDSLWALAAAERPGATNAQLATRWPQWYATNRERVGPDPDLLIPGTVLHPPERP